MLAKQTCAPCSRALLSRKCSSMAVTTRSRKLSTVTKAALKTGDRMQDYPDYFRVLRRSDGSSTTLSSFQGKQPVVLFFYPKQGTPGCTKEACAFRDEYSRFTDMGAAVFGISSDSPEENAAWAKANNLPFPLLTDSNSILRKSFGIPADFLGFLPGRQTYVIDKSGKVVCTFNNQFNAAQHVTEALNALKAAQ
ncbi:thioredoxin dependent peroxidase [Dunaliella salina]|uniref:thioredoxin-dependent peroxiredoxin n=1 Tax=Dunaliella salina TaxID=3046 RepID=A0ABQ7GVS4_DUNSA|nr:thioredoxin dependent peroxidase [Dunaliella salina]|eukprot:KAF5838716.1 thioredoxin dependent peroxidase [Dunaliella salina]